MIIYIFRFFRLIRIVYKVWESVIQQPKNSKNWEKKDWG